MENILILGKGPTKGLDDTTVTTEAQYLIDFSRSNIKLWLGLYYNGNSSFLFVNAKNKYSERQKILKLKNIPCFWY